MSAVPPPHPDPQVDASTPPLPPGWRGPAWAFHEHPARLGAVEVDYGYDWRLDASPLNHRVSWNPTTGELYAEQMRADLKRHAGSGKGAAVTILAVLPERRLVDALLDQYPYPAPRGYRSLDALAHLARSMHGWELA
jgi:CubicO group peptidase (beta-lactamase class C family)